MPSTLFSSSRLNINDNKELSLSGPQQTCLRQLLNDCGISFYGAPSVFTLIEYSPRFLTSQDGKAKFLCLLAGFLKNYRSTSQLYTMMTSRHIPSMAIIEGLVDCLQQQSFDSTALIILGQIAIETGNKELTETSILIEWCRGDNKVLTLISKILINIILQNKESSLVVHLAKCILSLFLESKSTQIGSELFIANSLSKESLTEIISSLNSDDTIMNSFLLFRFLKIQKARPLPEPFLLVRKILDRMHIKTIQFPQIYVDLCSLYIILSDDFTFEKLLTKEQERANAASWFFSQPSEESFLKKIVSEILDLFEKNLNMNKDVFVHEMLISILTICFTKITPSLNDLIKMEQILVKAANYPKSIYKEIWNAIKSWLSNNKNSDYVCKSLETKELLNINQLVHESPTKRESKLYPSPSSVAFFLPLIHLELNQTLIKLSLTHFKSIDKYIK